MNWSSFFFLYRQSSKNCSCYYSPSSWFDRLVKHLYTSMSITILGILFKLTFRLWNLLTHDRHCRWYIIWIISMCFLQSFVPHRNVNWIFPSFFIASVLLSSSVSLHIFWICCCNLKTLRSASKLSGRVCRYRCNYRLTFLWPSFLLFSLSYLYCYLMWPLRSTAVHCMPLLYKRVFDRIKAVS